MNFYVLTLFPDMIEAAMQESIFGRAVKNGTLSLTTINIRDFSKDKHRHTDDYPYGGGAGMVMQAAPVYDAYLEAVNAIGREKKTRVIYMTPQGHVFNQEMSKELAGEENLILLCGHYEGVDERVLNLIVTDNISIGDYVLTGGELAAMVVMDSISRNVDGVLSNSMSAEVESFHDNLLEYPQYTRPEVFMDMPVPEILLSGHHANIEIWRRRQSLIRTAERRPDLLLKANLTREDREFLESYFTSVSSPDS